jgi:nucleoside-diphosphate kinase
MFQKTLVLIKPDGIAKSLTGNIITKLSEAKLEIAACRCVRVQEDLAHEHYKHLSDKPFFSELIKYIMGTYHKPKVLAMVYFGEDALNKVRELAGATNPEEAVSDSIRGKYGRITTKGVYENVIHTSSDPQEAEREIKLWFQPDEIIFDLYPTKTTDITENRRVWA